MSTDPQPAFVAPPLDEIALLFPAYEIEGLIAQGGMGAVYKARQKSLDRNVAIKILPREFGIDPTFRDCFEAEAKAMARLNHPNLISVHDFGEANGLLYIVMEFVPGRSLFHSAHGTAIDPGEAGRIIAAVCDGLAHAHEHGILHRDIKPANILLTPKAEPKIGDFGLARPINRRQSAGETVFGTPHYTAPEVVSRPERVDTRADIFSIGVMFHELLAGKLPADDPRPPSVIAGSDPRFDGIVRRATHPVPELRYPDAAAMAREILAVTKSPAGPRPRALAAAPRFQSTPGPAGLSGQVTRALPVVRKPSPAGRITGILVGGIALVAALIFMNRSGPAPAPSVPEASPIAAVPPAEPEPVPEIAPLPVAPAAAPEPEPEPTELAAQPAEEPAAAPLPVPEPAKPSFDVAAWLDDKARPVMRAKAAPALERHGEALAENLKDFQRAVDRIIGKLDDAIGERFAESSDAEFDKMREAGNRIPPLDEIPGLAGANENRDRGFGRGFGRWPGRGFDFGGTRAEIADKHEEYAAKQKQFDDTLATELLKLQAVYFTGIELQIKRLLEQKDEVAADLLKAEIEATRGAEKRFDGLMRGLPAAGAAAGKMDGRKR